MHFFDTLAQMLAILSVIGAGYLANRLGFMGGETDGKISKLILDITMPAMILSAVVNGDDLPGPAEVLSVLKVAAVFYGLEFLVAFILPRLIGGAEDQQGVWRFSLVFPNVGFIGYPVSVALFGPEALFYAVILVLPFNLMCYTAGPLMLVGAKRFQWRQFLSPCTVAAAIALVISLAGYRPPEILGQCLNQIGSVTTPLSLILVGSIISAIPLGNILTAPRLWILSALRLLALPVCLLWILRMMGIDHMIVGVAVVLMGMPTAANGSMLCMEYGGDRETMAQATLLTTVVSIFTIPLLAMLLV